MIYNLNNPIDRSRAKKKIKELWSSNAVCEITEKKPRTRKQNSYLHVIIALFGLELGYTMTEAKFIYKDINADLYEYGKPHPNRLEVVTFHRSSNSLSVEEMTKTIERFRNWSSVEHGVYLPSSDEKRHILMAEVEIAKNHDFLY